MTEKKKCTKCGVEKSLEDFHRLNRTKDGRGYACKVCVNKANRAWAAAHPNYHQDYYQNVLKERRRNKKRLDTQADNETPSDGRTDPVERTTE